MTSGVEMQAALLACEVVKESRLTDLGPGHWYFLKLGDKIIPLGSDHRFADLLHFALVRNAKAFEREGAAQS